MTSNNLSSQIWCFKEDSTQLWKFYQIAILDTQLMIKYFMNYSKNILIFRKILKVSFYKDRSIEFCYHIWQHGWKHDFQNKFDKRAGGPSKWIPINIVTFRSDISVRCCTFTHPWGTRCVPTYFIKQESWFLTCIFTGATEENLLKNVSARFYKKMSWKLLNHYKWLLD